jgi:hypothetical protein
MQRSVLLILCGCGWRQWALIIGYSALMLPAVHKYLIHTELTLANARPFRAGLSLRLH